MNKKLLEYFGNDSLAASVWEGKYKYKDEETPKDMHRRMSKEFYRIDKKYQEDEPAGKNKLSEYGQKRKNLTEESIFNYFDRFKWIVPQGSVMAGLGTEDIVSLSNCVVIPSVMDSYGGIMYTDTQLAQLFKRRCGVGFDLSNLRPNTAPVQNSAKTTSGAVSFMERFSNTVRETSQSGRRGALMLTMDIRHPDSLEFIKIKRDLTKVTGANISVRLNDEFMKAIENDEDYILRFPCSVTNYDIPILEDAKYIRQMEYNVLEEVQMINKFDYLKGYIKKVKARELWDDLVKSAHNTAEPGVLFWDTMINYSPDGVYDKYRAISTNP